MAYVLLLALVALGIPLAISLRDRVNAEVRSQARSQADVVAASATESLHPNSSTLRRLVDLSAHAVRGRVIVVDRAGRVVADSAASDVGVDYGSRPEVKTALRGDSYQQTRHSDSLDADILATAVPVFHGGGRPIGAVRVTQSVAAVNSAIRTAILDLVLLAVVVLVLGLIAGALIAQQIARPIRRLDLAARRVAAGDVETKAPIEGSTEQRSLARTFNDMTDRISRLLRIQQDFVADASHQLRTPLTGLRLQLEEARAATPDEDPRANRLDAGITEVDRLSQMVDELLILSQAGEHELPGERVELADAADRAVARWARAADEASIALRRRDQPGSNAAWCARPDLDRALDAVIENAIRYSAPGSTIELVSRARGIEVLDQGPGLDPDETEAVFERFYRGRAGRQGPGGTGLGLPIARELLAQWGGTVSLSNADGGGARAVITLPERPDDASRRR